MTSKKKAVKKKPARKTAKRPVRKAANRIAKKQKTQELVVRVEQQQAVPTAQELCQPMMNGKSLTLQKTWLSEKALTHILQRTPQQHVYIRPAKGGGTWSYVTTTYVMKALNYMFGWNWDFEIVEHGIEGGQVWVKGRLTVKGNDVGQQITKSQFGRADIKFKKGGTVMLDFGNDLKAAASDCLKKCASMLGIASDVYGKTDYRQETGVAPIDAEAVDPNEPVVFKPGQVAGPDGLPTYLCQGCDGPITDQVEAFSMKVFKKRLCADCQKAAKRK